MLRITIGSRDWKINEKDNSIYKTVGGKKYFSPWSKVKTMKTKK
jgi:hypothetical protein